MKSDPIETLAREAARICFSEGATISSRRRWWTCMTGLDAMRLARRVSAIGCYVERDRNEIRITIQREQQ